jgi:L-amino acid N-acyltransferase YncA
MPASASTPVAIRKFRSDSTAQCYEAHVNGSERSQVRIRGAEPGDAVRLAEIFNQGVEDRVATFETHPATPADAERWVADDVVVIAARDGTVVGWAKASPYSDQHPYYDGVREATLYVERGARRSGIGRQLLSALAGAASETGAHKLIGKIFTSNGPSIALVAGLGWREVGVHERHGTLDGEWKDVLVVEKLL